jgi:hypothetical protein
MSAASRAFDSDQRRPVITSRLRARLRIVIYIDPNQAAMSEEAGSSVRF